MMKKTLTILAIAGLLGIPAHLSAQRAKTGNPVLPEFHADPKSCTRNRLKSITSIPLPTELRDGADTISRFSVPKI